MRQDQSTRRASGQHLRRRAAAPVPEFVGTDGGEVARYGAEERDLRRRRAIASLAAYGADVDEIAAATGLSRREVVRAMTSSTADRKPMVIS